MESQLVLEAWLVESAPKIRREPGGPEWIVADPALSPFTTRTFWRLLADVVTRCNLERVRSNIWHPVHKRSRMATLVRGQMHACARDCATTVPNGTTDSIGINQVHQYQKTKNLYVFASLTTHTDSEEFQAGASGEIDMSESAREKAAKWQKHQAKDENGVQAEMIATLVTGKQTKAKLADLWKLLFSFHGHGFGKNLSVKDRTSLHAWKNEFCLEFPDDVLFGEFLRDVFKDYESCRAYVGKATSFKDNTPEAPVVWWCYAHREHVIKWWLSSSEEFEFKGAQLPK